MSIALIERAAQHGDRIAITDTAGHHSYQELLNASARATAVLLEGRQDLEDARVAFMVAPGFDHVVTQWAIWRAGGIAVPLCLAHPEPELEYVLSDTDAAIAVVDAANAAKLQRLAERRGIRLLDTAALRSASPAAQQSSSSREAPQRALILYTSGTTSRPKGVVLTHDNLRAQIESLVAAWAWTRDDRILHVLPLHHTHGIVNVLLCALWSGATCEFAGGFDARRVWQRFERGGLTLFMAVPTMYVKLIAAWEEETVEAQNRLTDACCQFRLMVSGSAALPVSVFERWDEVTGHTLLERYGMTELGMALSNPLRGERRPGTVGQPLPGVEVRLMAEDGAVVAAGTAGEIQVRGPGVFKEYWRQPEATRAAFDGDWFRTGDVARIEDGYYRILGRSSVDIIKSGGYKISALEIEEALRQHSAVSDCAVVGVEDPEWGERICAAITAREPLTPDELRMWLSERIAPYKVPRTWRTVPELPRNPMGKVVKPEVKRLFL